MNIRFYIKCIFCLLTTKFASAKVVDVNNEEIIKHYKKGTAGFEQSSDDAKKWQNILDNLIGKARSPQSGWSGDLKDCDN